MTKRIAIIGCGWLGKALAAQLIAQQHKVVATTTTPDKLPELNALGCEARLLALPEADEQVFNWLTDVDVMVISLTPQFKKGQRDYAQRVAQLVIAAKQYQINKVILLSSTGIYQGNTGLCDESTAIHLAEEKASLLLFAEQTVLFAIEQPCILRLAGLVGPKRHPARFMAGKINVANPETPTNLVHQVDVVNAVCLAINSEDINGIYNVVSNTHPTRKSFYQQACQHLNLAVPSFNDQQETLCRVISNQKIKDFGLKLEYPDLTQWLEN